MKRSGFLPRRTPLHSHTKLRVVGHSDRTEIKERIQALIRAIAIARDGGGIFRFYPETGACVGYRKGGELILQFDHLHSRVHSASFADTRLGVTASKRHHIFYKPQHPDEYMCIAREQIGPERSALLTRVQEDRAPHRFFLFDWKLTEVALTVELAALPRT